MILKHSNAYTCFVTNATQFIERFQCQDWIQQNVKHYESYAGDDDGAFKQIVIDYLSSRKELYGVLANSKGISITCYYIPFVVYHNKQVFYHNNLELAIDHYISLAKVLLKEDSAFTNYPPEKIDFDIYQRLIANGNYKLKLIRNKKPF